MHDHTPPSEDDDQSLFELNNALTHLKYAHGLNRDARRTEQIGELVEKLTELVDGGQKDH